MLEVMDDFPENDVRELVWLVIAIDGVQDEPPSLTIEAAGVDDVVVDRGRRLHSD